MPFVVDTYGLRKKHNALHQQLAQLDAAESAFSRKKVIVAIDAPSPSIAVELEAAAGEAPVNVEPSATLPVVEKVYAPNVYPSPPVSPPEVV